jgi:hypothetical protein
MSGVRDKVLPLDRSKLQHTGKNRAQPKGRIQRGRGKAVKADPPRGAPPERAMADNRAAPTIRPAASA